MAELLANVNQVKMKIGSSDIISKSTLRTSSQLSITASAILIATIWSDDFSGTMIAGIEVFQTDAFFWVALVALIVQLLGHILSWLDDFVGYREFRNLAEDVGKRLEDITHRKNNAHADSHLGHCAGPYLQDSLNEFSAVLSKIKDFDTKDNLKSQQTRQFDVTKQKEIIAEKLPILREKSRELKLALEALAEEVRIAHPKAKAALRAAFWNFVIFRGLLPALFGLSALLALICNEMSEPSCIHYFYP